MQVEKKIWGIITGQIVTIASALFFLGSWVSDQDTHIEDTEIHLSPSELKEHFMPVEEAKSEFRAVNQKLDLLIEMQKEGNE